MTKTILLAIDIDEEQTWDKPMQTALDLCRLHDGELHVLAVVPEMGMSIVSQYFPAGYEKDLKDKVMETLRAYTDKHVPDGVLADRIVAQGTVYEEVLTVADKIKADVIVVRAHKPNYKDYLLGPNSARIVRHANCSVMVVRD